MLSGRNFIPDAFENYLSVSSCLSFFDLFVNSLAYDGQSIPELGFFQDRDVRLTKLLY